VENKAIKLEAKGHQGTFLRDIDYQKIWAHTGWKTLLGTMPLPGISKKLKGLTTAFCLVMKENKIPFNFAFMQSAKTRIETITNSRNDFIIVSKLTAELLNNNYKELEIALELPKKTYTDENVIVFSKKSYNKIENGMKIAYDENSIDQKYLTDILTENIKVEKINMPYISTKINLKKGNIDAIIYRKDSIDEDELDLNYIKIDSSIANNNDTQAVIITNKNNYYISELIKKNINQQRIKDIQDKVVAGKRKVSYY
jgi:hypothetical protein